MPFEDCADSLFFLFGKTRVSLSRNLIVILGTVRVGEQWLEYDHNSLYKLFLCCSRQLIRSALRISILN